MPLADHEWTLVRCLVVDHLVATATPADVLQTYFPNDFARWKISQIPGQNADMLIRQARDAGLVGAEPMAIRLLEALERLPTVKPLPDYAKVLEYLERLKADQARLSEADPYSDSVLTGSGQIFIDRHPVRESLRQLVDPPPQRPEPLALRVTGERSTGKSYTFALIMHVSEPGRFRPAKVLLGRTSTAEDIVRELAVQVAGPSARPDPVDDPSKRLRYWALWLVEQARRSLPDRPWWFVFDQCNELDPGSDAVELISQLALAIAEMSPDPGQRRPRLVLLGYNDNLADLPLPRRQVSADKVERANGSDVRAFFHRVISRASLRSANEAALDDAEVEEQVAIVVQQVLRYAEEADRAGNCYMRALSVAAEEVLDAYPT